MKDFVVQANLNAQHILNHTNKSTNSQNTDFIDIVISGVTTENKQEKFKDFELMLSEILSSYLSQQTVAVFRNFPANENATGMKSITKQATTTLLNPIEMQGANHSNIVINTDISSLPQNISIQIPDKNINTTQSITQQIVTTVINSIKMRGNNYTSAKMNSDIVSPPTNITTQIPIKHSVTEDTTILQKPTLTNTFDSVKGIEKTSVPETRELIQNAEEKQKQPDNKLNNKIINSDIRKSDNFSENGFLFNPNLNVIKISNYNSEISTKQFNAKTITAEVDKIITANIKEGTTFDIELFPKELGKVNVKMTVNGDFIKMVITCEKNETKHALMNGFPKLGDVLEKQMGFNINVEYSQNTNQSFSGQGFGDDANKNPYKNQYGGNTTKYFQESFEDYINELIEKSYFFI